jgi:hypothetical protein
MNRGFEGGYGYGREVGHDKDRAENHGGSRVGCWNGGDVSGSVLLSIVSLRAGPLT